MNGATGAGQLHLFIGADGTPGAGETLLRAEGSTIVIASSQNFGSTPASGLPSHLVRLDAAASGQVNAGFTGRIVKVGTLFVS